MPLMPSLRRVIVRATATVVLLSLTAPAIAGDALKQFSAMEVELADAAQSYYEAMVERHAESLKKSGKNPNSENPLPPDHRGSLLDKMDAFVSEHIKDPDALQMAIATFGWSLELGFEGSADRFDRLVRHFPNRRRTAEQLDVLDSYDRLPGDHKTWIDALSRLSASAKEPTSKQAAAFVKGRVQMSADMLAEAAQTFKALIAKAPDSQPVARAKQFLYEIEHLQIGMTAPNFEATTLDGKKVTLESLRGKPVLINFWATWCPPCVAEIPHLRAGLARYNNGFEILAVSADYELNLLKRTANRLKAPGIQTWDYKDGVYPIVEQYNVQGYPTWYLLDKNGVIRARDPFGDALFKSIEEVLKNPDAPPAKGS